MVSRESRMVKWSGGIWFGQVGSEGSSGVPRDQMSSGQMWPAEVRWDQVGQVHTLSLDQ